MSDPNYMHEFDPSRKGLCKVLAGGRHCGLAEDAIVHKRFADIRRAEEDSLSRSSSMLTLDIKLIAKYIASRGLTIEEYAEDVKGQLIDFYYKLIEGR